MIGQGAAILPVPGRQKTRPVTWRRVSSAQPTLFAFSTYMIVTATLVSLWIQVLMSASFLLYALNVHTLHLLVLQGVDGSQNATYDVRSCTQNIGLRRTFRWVFTIANVKQAILGADFLHHFGLVVDMRHCVLLDSNTHLSIHGILSDPSSSSPSIIRLQLDYTDPYLTLLSEFLALTQPYAADQPIKHDVV